jgi:CRISPR type III-B/RAMP module RAMP protein Cmr1
MAMEKKLFSLIYGCLKENRSKLQLPVRQRAKVENWLKVELLYSIWQELLHGNHKSEIEIERPYPKNKKLRCDIFFTTPRKRHVYLELKIVNTSYNCNYNRIPKKTKAIADNVESVIDASKRLRKLTNKGDERIVAFVVYPLCKEKLSKWKYHESKINDKIGKFFIDPEDLYVFLNNKRIFMRLYLYRVT